MYSKASYIPAYWKDIYVKISLQSTLVWRPWDKLSRDISNADTNLQKASSTDPW